MMDSFVLKRVGKYSGGPNGVLNLTPLVTRVGRHSMNNYCMDSNEWPCLISRFHSAITREEADGVVQFSIYDCKSMNGTFLNSIKIPPEKNVRLTEGDVITFGCRGGNNVKEGERATEESSEFQYMFMRRSEMNNAHKGNFTSPKGHQNGTVYLKGLTKSDASTGLNSSPATPQLTKGSVNSSNAYQREKVSQSSKSKVQTMPLKNALNNSTGHLTLPSEQRTPITGSQKRKNTVHSSSKSMASSHLSENGNANKRQKTSDSSKGQQKAKAQRMTRKAKQALTYSDEELCSARNCQKPSAETLSWVQCDDCDGWFHVDCVGSIRGNYNIEQLEEAEFHCGCV